VVVLLLARCAGGAQQVASEAPQACPLEVPRGILPPGAAWAAVASARPGHITAPLPGEVSPPITVEGLCDSSRLSSSGFAHAGIHGGAWTAVLEPPAGSDGGVVLGSGGGACLRPLSGLSVAAAGEQVAPSLRLHFAGACDPPAAVLELRLANGTQRGGGLPLVSDVPLADFVCQVAAEQCALARGRLTASASSGAGSAPSSNGSSQATGEVGIGRCSGAGVRSADAPNLQSSDACAQACRTRLEQNLEDNTQMSCKGFAWSDKLRSCLLYDQWPVTESDGSTEDGYHCWEPTASPAQSASSTTTAPEIPATREVQLDLAGLLDGAAGGGPGQGATARLLQVAPDAAGCFEAFEWYTLDRLLHVPPGDMDVLREMTKAGSAEFTFPSPPHADVTVERVCVRDCSGALHGDCELEEAVTVTKVLTTTSEGPDPTENHTISSDSLLFGRFELALHDAMGHDAFEAVVAPDTVPWTLALSCLSAILGFVLARCLAAAACAEKDEPSYQTVQSIRLVYDGEDGPDEEMVMQTVPGSRGTVMQSVSAPLGTGAWRPSKASAGASAASGFFSSPPRARTGATGLLQTAR